VTILLCLVWFYLLGGAVAAWMALVDERAFLSEHPHLKPLMDIPGAMALACLLSWLSVALIVDQRREDSRLKAGRK
jgi:hypothetical protein